MGLEAKSLKRYLAPPRNRLVKNQEVNCAKFSAVIICKQCLHTVSAFPDPLLGVRSWTPLGEFRLPDFLGYSPQIKIPAANGYDNNLFVTFLDLSQRLNVSSACFHNVATLS